MTDKKKVYSKVLKMLKTQLPTTSQYHVVVLAMMVAGIVLGKNVQLSHISLQIPSSAKPDSLTKRFHRFVKNPLVVSEQIFLPFAQQILSHLGQEITLVMDASQTGRGCMTLMVAVLYKKRAIPVVWLVYQGKKGHTTADRHLAVLHLLFPLIPEGVRVTLLGDGEYDTVDMLDWVSEETNWTFVVRTAPQILITHGGMQYPIRELLAGEESCMAATDAFFTQKEHGPVMVIAWWLKPHKKPIYLVSNGDNLQAICNAYRRRFKIETLFSDKKRRGFHLHNSHLSDPERVSRLLIATAIAYMWMVYLGVEVDANEKKRCLVDRSTRTDKSLFRLGLDWFTYAMTNGLDIHVLFRPPITLFQ